MNVFTTLNESIVTIALAIIGVAALAVLVSRNADTASVIQAGASGFGNSLDVAISPVTGATTRPILDYPTPSFSLNRFAGTGGAASVL